MFCYWDQDLKVQACHFQSKLRRRYKCLSSVFSQSHTAVCNLGLIILEADAVREEGERNRKARSCVDWMCFPPELLVHLLVHLYRKASLCNYTSFLLPALFPLMSEKLRVILSSPVVLLHFNEIFSLMEQPPSFLKVYLKLSKCSRVASVWEDLCLSSKKVNCCFW